MWGIRSNGRALHLASTISAYKRMQRLEYPVAKLVFVPKDSRGPRIISSEPLELQYVQQGVARLMMRHLARHPLTRGRINFIDQTVNAGIALSSSASGEYATLDLSDASDRLSCALFLRVWPRRLIPKFMALRSHATTLPGGEEFRLRKFAPMGSAICFPVESVIFWAICVAALRKQGLTLREAARCVYVYGDDIIVPVEYFNAVVKALHSVDLKVNVAKSFAGGLFRESCGIDAFDGQIVTPVRIKRLPGRRPHDGAAHAAWLAYAGHLLDIGCENAGLACKRYVESVLGEIPFTHERLGYLSCVTRSRPATLPTSYRETRWNAGLQRWEAKVWILRDKRRRTSLSEWNRLNRAILDPDPIAPDEVVVKDATLIRRGWLDIPATFSAWVLGALE